MRRAIIVFAALIFHLSLASEAVAAPRFSVARQEQAWWLVRPDGTPFFSVGVCCVSQGIPRADYDPENPGYAAWQHYATPLDWAETTLRRLQEWRFTTIGGWSDYKLLRQSKEMNLAFAPVLHIGSTAGAPWWDMWNPKNIRRMEDVARPQILAFRDDPRLLGYYSDNEMGWWNATLFKMTLEQAPSSGQRKRLIALLRETYHGDWEKLLVDFEVEKADSWRALSRGGMMFVRPGGQGMRVMRRFLGLMAERYYQLCHDIIRKYDPNALILGDRYQSFYYPEVARAAGRYVDVISSNLNASWNDGTFLRCYLDTLHQLTGKPILISEIYMASKENRSGNKNNQGIFPVVSSQAERARAARNTLTALAQLPYVVGIDWFQYADEPRHGRPDGENFDFGLVDIQDRPYEDLVAMFSATAMAQLKSGKRMTRADASQGVPRAPSSPLEPLQPMSALENWDRQRGFVPPSSELPIADLYVCWAPEAFYLGVYGWDIIEDAYYRDRSVPKGDRPVWTVELNGRPIRARLGAGREPLVNDPEVSVSNLSGLNINVRNLAVMEIPAKRLGKDQFRTGDSVKLICNLVTHGQAYQMDWKGTFTLKD